MVRSSVKSLAQEFRSQGTASILAIATANPVNHYLQSEFPDFYFRITNSNHMTELKNKFKRICMNSGIRKRHMYLTEEILRNNPTRSISVMQELVAREVPLLGMKAAKKAIAEWGRPVSDITHLIFATASVVGTPTADLQLAKLLGLCASVRRHFVYGQACSGGSTALRLAMDIVGNDSAARVLIVSSENMAVSFSAPLPDNLVGQAIFGDGAAAVVIGGSTTVGGSERPLFEMVSAFDIIIPGSEGAVTGTLTNSGSVPVP